MSGLRLESAQTELQKCGHRGLPGLRGELRKDVIIKGVKVLCYEGLSELFILMGLRVLASNSTVMSRGA